jgi:hypothetical protein
MHHRQERVRLETAHHTITGTLTLSREGYRSRISDVLNAAERDFIALTEVAVQARGDGEAPTEHAFIAVHRGQIVFAVPLGDVQAQGATQGAEAA